MCSGIGIEQQLVRIEAMSGCGLVRAVNPIAVEGAWADIRQVSVKDSIGVFGERDPLDLGLAIGIEQTNFDLGRVSRKDREVRALSVPT